MGTCGDVPPAPSWSSLPAFVPLGIATERGDLTLEKTQGLEAIQLGPLTGTPTQSTSVGFGGASVSQFQQRINVF